MTVNIDELKGYLKIDKYALDDEVVNQPSLLYKVSEAYVDAAADRDGYKDILATVDAKLDAEIRSSMADEKPTEGQIKSLIQANTKHMMATDKYLLAKHKADQLSVLKDAFQQRGYMLRDLVQLHTSNYFEATSVRSTPNQDRMVYHQRIQRLKELKLKEAKHAKERA